MSWVFNNIAIPEEDNEECAMCTLILPLYPTVYHALEALASILRDNTAI